jgi:hypothetical protein
VALVQGVALIAALEVVFPQFPHGEPMMIKINENKIGGTIHQHTLSCPEYTT